MLKKILITLILCISLICICSSVFALADGILESQKKSLNISDFTKEVNKYTKEVFPDADADNLIDLAISGKINNKSFFEGILNLFFKEILDTLKIVAGILIIIIIHSILKNINTNLNGQTSEIAFYVEYILIVTIIMTNFADIIGTVKNTVSSLVGFMQTLVPLLITLMMITGNIITTSLVQPILLFIIQFIGNFLQNFILPLVLVGTVFGIISNISEKVQLGKLSKYFKSSTVWILGIILTVFVGVISLEGAVATSADGIAAKTTKAAVSSFIPVVRKDTPAMQWIL